MRQWGAVVFLFASAFPASAIATDPQAPPPSSSDPLIQSASPALPAAPDPPPPLPRRWTNWTDGSCSRTTGNDKRSTFSLRNTYNYNWTKYQVELIGSAFVAMGNGQTLAEEYNASEKTKYAVGEDYFIYERFGWDKNYFAGLRARYDASIGLGRRLINGKNIQLTGEAGAGKIYEKRIDVPNYSYVSGRLYAKYMQVLGAGWNFSQDVEYLRDLADAPAYRLNTETALISVISTHFSLSLSYVSKVVNRPVPGFAKNDTITSVALSFNY